jgi:hypothetical protein
MLYPATVDDGQYSYPLTLGILGWFTLGQVVIAGWMILFALLGVSLTRTQPGNSTEKTLAFGKENVH